MLQDHVLQMLNVQIDSVEVALWRDIRLAAQLKRKLVSCILHAPMD